MHATETVDRTNYVQSLMHMIKGNLGTGILAMPASFSHFGLINAVIILPVLCIISTCCVHLLVKSSRHVSGESNGSNFDYASLAKYSFRSGPLWMRKCSTAMCLLVDGVLILTQIGICSVYLVFVVDNLTKIFATYHIYMRHYTVFLIVFPAALLISYIRTLRRLAIASALANLLQVLGLTLILQYLVRDLENYDLSERHNFMPLSHVALGFGSAMFAFEGISVVLPVYNKMKNQNQMQGYLGVINVSYGLLLVLYFAIGLFGFLKFGLHAKDSITLNLPATPLYDLVRAIFGTSVFLTYPLQFYVPHEIIWNFIRKNYLQVSDLEACASKAVEMGQSSSNNKPWALAGNSLVSVRKQQRRIDIYDYLCRTVLVIITFVIAVTIPKLNLLMDLVGSISGTALCFTLPAIIHLAAYWDSKKGASKALLIVADGGLVVFSIIAGSSGAVSSIAAIIKSFRHK